MTTLSAQQIEATRQRTLIDAKLRRAWHKERRYHHYRAACQVTLWVLALFLIDFLLDWRLHLPYYGRLLLLSFNLGVLAWALWHYWLRHLRRFDPVRVALQVEAHNPELESLLVSFVQLRGDDAAGQHASPALLDAMRRQAVEVTTPLDFKQIISYKQLKRILLVSLLAVTFFTAISINWSDYFHALLVRMFDPTADMQYPTRTKILGITGSKVVQQGDLVVIEVSVGGSVPQEGKLHMRGVDGDWERLPLLQGETPTPDDGLKHFAARFADVYQSFDYWVKIGDDQSEKYTVTVVPEPQIIETKVRVRYPDYTAASAVEKDVLNLQVPEGTQLTWQLKLDRPIRNAQIIPDSGGLVPQGEQKPDEGGLLEEVWKGIVGGSVQQLTDSPKFGQKPDMVLRAKNFQQIENLGDNFGVRMRGFLVAPRTGDYRFWISSDDTSELWLSSSADPAAKRKIAEVNGYRLSGDWDSTEEQQSGEIRLRRGERYYIEGLFKEGSNADHFAVAWKGPSIDERQIIQGKYLMPWEGETGAPVPPQDMQIDASGQTVTFTATAGGSFGYQFRWTEKEHGYNYQADVQHYVLVTPDGPPQVELVHPSEDIKATVRKTLNLTYRANDDYGVAKAVLIWQLNDGEEHRIDLGRYGKPVVEDTRQLRLSDVVPQIAEGDTFTYAVEVDDNREGGTRPQTARSAARNMYIVSIPEYQQYIYERIADMTREVKDVHEVEVEGEGEVGTILKQGADAPGGN